MTTKESIAPSVAAALTVESVETGIKSDGGHDAFLMKNDNYFEIMRTYIEANKSD